MAAVFLIAAAVAGGNDASAPLVSVGQGISVRLPTGWHLVRKGVGPSHGPRPVSLQPAVVASFAVAFSSRPCQCANPNCRTCGQWGEETAIRNFPRTGVLVYVWEFPSPRNPADLGRGYRPRPAARFRVAQNDPHFEVLARELRDVHAVAGHACVEGPGSHPSWWSDFRDAGRVFQVEVYLGPAAEPAVRARADALLDSLNVLHPAPPRAMRVVHHRGGVDRVGSKAAEMITTVDKGRDPTTPPGVRTDRARSV